MDHHDTTPYVISPLYPVPRIRPSASKKMLSVLGELSLFSFRVGIVFDNNASIRGSVPIPIKPQLAKCIGASTFVTVLVDFMPLLLGAVV